MMALKQRSIRRIYVLFDFISNPNAKPLHSKSRLQKVKVDKETEFLALSNTPEKLSISTLRAMLNNKFLKRKLNSKNTRFVIVENPLVYNLLVNRDPNSLVTDGDTMFGPNKKYISAKTSANTSLSAYNKMLEAKFFLVHS